MWFCDYQLLISELKKIEVNVFVEYVTFESGEGGGDRDIMMNLFKLIIIGLI